MRGEERRYGSYVLKKNPAETSVSQYCDKDVTEKE